VVTCVDTHELVPLVTICAYGANVNLRSMCQCFWSHITSWAFCMILVLPVTENLRCRKMPRYVLGMPSPESKRKSLMCPVYCQQVSAFQMSLCTNPLQQMCASASHLAPQQFVTRDLWLCTTMMSKAFCIALVSHQSFLHAQ
jgi:hypothetical protein